MKTFQSTPITFIDQTDSRKLEVYITSNLPTMQIFNGNSGAYTPNWTEGEKLILSMDVFLDSRAMTIAEYNSTAIKWYKNDVEMSDGSIEDISDDKRKITIKDNILKDSEIITYTCEATYQGIVASTRITFTRVDTGLNGEKGSDGTSVKILGTASSVTKVGGTNYYTITYSEGAVVAAALGDAYVYGGELYVCSVLDGEGANDYFINVGPIQGEPGEPAKSIALIGSSQVFRVGKDGESITPQKITVTAHSVNIEDTTRIKWEYRYNAAGVWTTITDKSADEVVSLANNVATIDSSKLASTTTSVVLRATFEDAEDVLTVYKTFDGADGDKGTPAPLAFLTNENVSFVADYNGVTSIAQSVITKVVAYVGEEKVVPQIGDLSVANAGLNLIGMNIEVDELVTEQSDKEIALKLTVQSGVNLGSALSIRDSFAIPVIYPISTPLSLNWSKVNAGTPGAVGATGDNAVTFQVYSNNGYALSAGIPTLLLQTFAYFGDVEITAGATFQWYRHNNTDWVAVSGATNAYFNVSRDDVSFSNNYMCKMQFNGTEYVGVVTIEDKNDENKVFASKPSNYFSGDLWIVGTDYAPGGFAVGTMLRAEHTNSTYADSDWVAATKYDDDINSLRETVDEYKQYFSVNSANGFQIGNSSINNDVLTIDTINAASVNSDSASFESLDVVGRYSGSTMLQAPVINLGNFSLVIESNGSLSIVANT